MQNLTSTYKIPSAETELALDPGVMQMGAQIGGISAFNNSFKRGYGDRMFGTDDRGSWWGAADYVDAPVKVSMEGQFIFSSLDGSGNQLIIDSENLRIVLYIAGVPQALWGFHENGF